MSNQAEKAALKAYPITSADGHGNLCEGCTAPTNNDFYRGVYLQGYHQAEKDVIALIESRIEEILGDAQPKPILRLELRDLIRKINE